MGGVQSFFGDLVVSTQQAFDTVKDTKVVYIDLASIKIKLNFAGENLMPFVLPAIAHLCSDTTAFDFEIHLWDATHIGVPFPEAPNEINSIGYRGEVIGFPDNLLISFIPDARILSCFDKRDSTAIVAFVSEEFITPFEIACSLRTMFSWILDQHQIHFLHTAAVGTSNGALLIAGNSGAGKSSTALRCLEAGMYYYGDDVCAVSYTDLPRAYSVYSSAKSTKSDIYFIQHFAPYLHKAADDSLRKNIFFFADLLQQQDKQSDELRAVIIPKVDVTQKIQLLPISSAQVMSIIASSTLILLPNSGNEIRNLVTKLVKNLPCYQLILGDDPAQIPLVLSELLAELNHDKSL